MQRSTNFKGRLNPLTGRRGFLTSTVTAASAALFSGQGITQSVNRSLSLYSWPDYTGKSTLKEFSALTGISVTRNTYDDSEEMLATISREDNPYDVVIASYDYVEEMIGKNLLLPLNYSLIPNVENLNPVFRDSGFDPGRLYSMPFLWGTQGICFRKSALSETPKSWDSLFKSTDYSGRIALPGADTIGLALKYLGYSYNSVNPDELEVASTLLIKQKPHIKSFDGSKDIEMLANGDVDIAVGWNSEILGLMDTDDDIGYSVPVEGSLLWQDCICLSRTTSNALAAHELLNFALRADVAAAIAEEIWYATPNRAALELLTADYRDDHTIFPGTDILKRCEPALNLGETGTRLRDEIWTKVLAA